MIPDIIEPPLGCTWGRYVEMLSQAHGGQTALADLLFHRGKGVVDLPIDPQTVERALRRLTQKGNAPGGKYGRWLIRFFGVPDPLWVSARWMGQYHSRFADLPTSLRYSQLVLWDRPPICETRAAAWIHLGFASVAMRRREHDEASSRVERARVGAKAGRQVAVEIEAELLVGRLASERGDASGALRALARVADRVADVTDASDQACYRARLADQLAYRLLHPSDGPRRLEEARAQYASIPESDVPFAQFRRAHGLAYCAWKSGANEEALAQVRQASEFAADGGLVRFRAMALKLQARIVGGAESASLLARAKRMAAQLEQEDLIEG